MSLNGSIDSLDGAINPELYWRGPLQTGGRLVDHIEISKTYKRCVKMLRTEGTAFRVSYSPYSLPTPFQARFKNMDATSDIVAVVREALHLLLQQIEDPQPDDKIGIQIRHPEIDPSILAPFQSYRQLNEEVIVRLFADVSWTYVHLSAVSRLSNPKPISTSSKGSMPRSSTSGRRRDVAVHRNGLAIGTNFSINARATAQGSSVSLMMMICAAPGLFARPKHISTTTIVQTMMSYG
jgi:hypothetical protein